MLCAIGAQRQLRVYVLTLDKQNHELLFELRERHREIFDGFADLAGLQVKIRKEGSAPNSPVNVICGEFVYVIKRDIARLVATFGLPPLLIKTSDREEAENDLRNKPESSKG